LIKTILYYTARDMTSINDGINFKIHSQVDTLINAGFSVLFVYRKGNILYIRQEDEITVIKSKMSRPYKMSSSRFLMKYLKNFLKVKHIDGIYCRYVFADMSFQGLIQLWKKYNIKTAIEIPTYPYDSEFQGSFENQIVLILDKMYRMRLSKYVDRIITYSEDNEIFGIKTIKTINGIDLNRVKIINSEFHGDVINLIAVAGLAKWHGYDRLINGIGAYYKNGGKQRIVFHIIGDGTEISYYRKLISDYEINDEVILCGFKSGEELSKIYNLADIAIDSLGNHRKGIYIASSLKSREYAARGLPILTTQYEDSYPEEYQLLVPSDDTNIDILDVIKFMQRLISTGKGVNQIAYEIRNYAHNRIDMASTFKDIISYYNES
jgi:hypothetical protein